MLPGYSAAGLGIVANTIKAAGAIFRFPGWTFFAPAPDLPKPEWLPAFCCEAGRATHSRAGHPRRRWRLSRHLQCRTFVVGIYCLCFFGRDLPALRVPPSRAALSVCAPRRNWFAPSWWRRRALPPRPKLTAPSRMYSNSLPVMESSHLAAELDDGGVVPPRSSVVRNHANETHVSNYIAFRVVDPVDARLIWVRRSVSSGRKNHLDPCQWTHPILTIPDFLHVLKGYVYIHPSSASTLEEPAKRRQFIQLTPSLQVLHRTFASLPVGMYCRAPTTAE